MVTTNHYHELVAIRRTTLCRVGPFSPRVGQHLRRDPSARSAIGPASSPATDRGTESRRAVTRVLGLPGKEEPGEPTPSGREPPHRQRRRDRHRAFQAAIRPAPLRPPIPRRDRPCRNEGPRAFSSCTHSTAASRCQPARAVQRRQQPALLQQAEPQLTSSAAAAAADRRCAAAGCSCELAKQAHRCSQRCRRAGSAAPHHGRPARVGAHRGFAGI